MPDTTTRIRLDTLNLSLKGYAPETVDQLTRELPGAIAMHLAQSGAPAAGPGDLTGQVAQQVAAQLRGCIEGQD